MFPYGKLVNDAPLPEKPPAVITPVELIVAVFVAPEKNLWDAVLVALYLKTSKLIPKP